MNADTYIQMKRENDARAMAREGACELCGQELATMTNPVNETMQVCEWCHDEVADELARMSHSEEYDRRGGER